MRKINRLSTVPGRFFRSSDIFGRAVTTATALILAFAALVLAGCGMKSGTDDQFIEMGGHRYQLKKEIITYLLLGVDTEGSLREEKEPGMAGQSDAIYLVVCDKSSKSARIIGVPRDTMTTIRVFLPSGKDNGTSTDHLTLQYAFGDGMEKSCELTEEAVSNLLYGIPIDGYLAVNLGAVPDFAESLGGIEVVVPDDSAKMEESSFVKGAKVTLDRTNVKKFLRFRNTEVSQSAVIRMERHKAFFKGCAKKLRSIVRSDPAEILRLYRECSPQLLTDISADKCVELAGYDFDETVVILPGEKKSGDEYDEFYIDEDALQEMIADIFCCK